MLFRSKVREVGPGGCPRGEEMVLKDFWIPEDSKTEGQIQAEIFESARRELSDKSDPEGFRKYFMTIVHDTVVKIDKHPDTSRLFLRGTFNPNQCSQRPLHLPSVPTDKCDRPKAIPFKDMKHCRLVFKEVGTPLHRVKDLKVVFQCLYDALQGPFSLSDVPSSFLSIP